MAMRLDQPFDAEAIQDGPLDRAARRAVRAEVDGWCSYRNMSMRLTGPGHGVDNPGGGGGGGSGDTLLGIATVTEATGASKTNEPITLVWTPPPGTVSSLRNIKAYDNGVSGVGTQIANIQIDNKGLDAQGLRQVRVSLILPAIAANATRKIYFYQTDDAMPTGTAITEADIFATTYRVLKDFDIGGTTFSADSDTCEGVSSTPSRTAPYRMGTYVSGVNETALIYRLPPTNGGSAHASGDGLHVELHIYARKAGLGGVDGGNPITYIKTRVVWYNMDAARASPANYWYGVNTRRATSLSDATLINTDYTDPDGNVTRYNYPRSQPAATLTATGATVINNDSFGAATYSWTISTGTWASDILGAHITDGTGYAYVVERTNSTTIKVRVFKAFSGTSFTSGNWTIEGVGHEYGRKWDEVVHIGTVPTCHVVWGDHNSADASDSNAAMAFLIAAQAMMNYGFGYADVTHSMTNLNLMRADNAVRPFTQTGPELQPMGDVFTDIGGTGERDDIGPHPAWVIDGVTKFNSDGRRKIFENNRYWASSSYNSVRRLTGSPSTGSLGVCPRSDAGTEWGFNTAFDSVDIAVPVVRWNPFDGDNSHHPATALVPFLLTGEFMHLQEQQDMEYYAGHLSSDSAYQGDGIDKTPFGDGSLTARGDAPWGSSLQQRAEGYTLRDAALAYFMTPDNDNNGLYNSKSYYASKCAKAWGRFKFVMDNYTNGSAGALEDYFVATDGMKFVGYRFNGNYDFGIFQNYTTSFNFKQAYELGYYTSDTVACMLWYGDGVVGNSQSADVCPDWTMCAYFFPRWVHPANHVAIQTFAEGLRAYKDWPLNMEASAVGRTPAAFSLSGTSGTALVLTVSGNPFLNGGSWYAASGDFLGGHVWQTDGTGRGRIQSVTNGNQVVISTQRALTNASPGMGAITAVNSHPNGGYFAIQDYWLYQDVQIGSTLTFTNLSVAGNNATFTVIGLDGTRAHVTPNPTDMSADSAYNVTVDNPFSSTTPTLANCRICLPHPSDQPTVGSQKTWGSAPDYPIMHRAAAACFKDFGVPAAQDAVDYIDNHDFHADMNLTNHRYNINPR